MIDQSAGGQIGALLQSLAQNNPQVFQAIMQMVQAQRQQGVGGIGSLMPRGGMSPRGDNSMIGGPMPMVRPDMARHLSNPNLAGNARDAIMGRPSNMAYEVGAFYPPGLDRFPMPSGANGPSPYGAPTPYPRNLLPGMGGLGMGSAAPQPTGPKYMPQQPYAQPTGPKYMPPTGPKTYGQTMPAEAPPSFAQPKPFPQQPAQQPMAGNGTTGLDWYAMQAGN